MGGSDSLTSALEEALAAVEAAKVPADLRETAFAKSLDHLLGVAQPPAPSITTPPASNAPSSGTAPATTTEAASSSGTLEAIATRLNVDRDVAAAVLDVDENGVHLHVPTSSLPTEKQRAMQEITYVVVAARQAGALDDDWTSISLVREVCDDRGVLDAGNFAKALGKIDGEGIRFRGARNTREAKLNQRGYEKASEIIKRIGTRDPA
jgi:hypothetical protein